MVIKKGDEVELICHGPKKLQKQIQLADGFIFLDLHGS